MRRIDEMNKKGLSNLVAYVLLISITLSLSVMVYGWLKFYVSVEEVADCPGNVEIMIQSYSCLSGEDGSLAVNLKNKGFFDIDGFVLRVNDREEAEFGYYVFDEVGVPLSSGQTYSATYDFSVYNDANGEDISDITLVDIQPYINEDGKVACQSYASQRVECVAGFSYDGFALGESFYDLKDDRIFIFGTASCPAAGVGFCKIQNDPSSIKFEIPHIPVAGSYDVTYDVEMDVGNNGEDYAVSCGGHTSTFPDSGVIDGRANVSIICDFSVGSNEIVFEAVSTTSNAIDFYYLKIRGPIA